MSLYKMNYYPELDRHNRNKIKVEWYISNNATKSEVKNGPPTATSEFADLASTKSDVDNLDANKLQTIPTDLSELNDVVDNDVVKKTRYDTLVKKVNTIGAIDTSELVKKLATSEKLKKLRRKYLTILNTLLLLNFINQRKEILVID